MTEIYRNKIIASIVMLGFFGGIILYSYLGNYIWSKLSEEKKAKWRKREERFRNWGKGMMENIGVFMVISQIILFIALIVFFIIKK